jgi:ribosomal protein S18 acetylase RimI-like enzyme
MRSRRPASPTQSFPRSAESPTDTKKPPISSWRRFSAGTDFQLASSTHELKSNSPSSAELCEDKPLYYFRPFRNSDPPKLANLWNRQAAQRGLAQPISAELLERCLFSCPTFEREGLIVATRDDMIAGFVHVGFGSTEDRCGLCTDLGTICMLMVDPTIETLAGVEGRLGSELLAHGEQYLRDHGATVLYAGSIQPLETFYLGLYGGSELPGILASDVEALAFYQRYDYEAIDRVCVLHCDLDRVRPTFDRRQLRLRREMQVTASYDPPATSWWDAVTASGLERTRFDLICPADSSVLASVEFWNMEPLASSWGIRAAGMTNLTVNSDRRRAGIATRILSEAFRSLKTEGITQVEAQTMTENQPARALYESLGFVQIDEGVVLRKKPPNP